MSTPHVVIIGGGFGGIATAQALRGAPVRITLIDRRNHHLFQPLLYQVATAALAPSDIAEPLRGVLRNQANVEVLLAEVTGIDTERREVQLHDERLSYDTLVVAAGARTSYFGHDDWEAHAPGLKTIGDALDIRHRILSAFEQAEWASDEERDALCTFVVVGGGPTGVETAGAIREIATHTLASDFRHIDPTRIRVLLVEAGPNILGTFHDTLQQSARDQLQRLGVEVRSGEAVEAIGEGFVVVNGERIATSTVVWAAGVRGAAVGSSLGVPLDRAGRVMVGPDLSIEGHPEVFVIGDLAHASQPHSDKPVPGVAPAAIQMGAHVGKQIRTGTRTPFAYTDTGSLATIGRRKAVADLRILRFSGFGAWIVWVFVHLMTLVGHRNRIVVFAKWAWAWLTYDRSSRLLWQDEATRIADAARKAS